MKRWFRIIRRSWLLFLFGLFIASYIYSILPKIAPCKNPFEVRDYISTRGPVQICNGAFYRGSIKITDIKQFPDLFQFKLSTKNEIESTKQYVRVYEMDKTEVISIISTIDYLTWFNTSIGVYRKEGKSYKQIFKKTFADHMGRYADIRFVPSGDETGYDLNAFFISGDLGWLGCYGCRINWKDYYSWDSYSKTYVLSNNKYPNEFKKLLTEYEENDQKICRNENGLDDSITNLYSSRMKSEKYCGDNAIAPYTSSGQATIFLKGKQAIKKILDGQNISVNEVSKIKL